MNEAPKTALPSQRWLDAELRAGNFIVEVSSWPPKCKLLVILGRSFMAKENIPIEITYHGLNDPNYWRAEYRYEGGTELLACKG